jgi:hypothetical protein
MIQVGSTVTIQEDGYEEETYTIVGAAEANPREGKISRVCSAPEAILSDPDSPRRLPKIAGRSAVMPDAARGESNSPGADADERLGACRRKNPRRAT